MNAEPTPAASDEERQAVPLRAMPAIKPSLNEVSDFDRLIATGEKLLRYQQARVSAAESEYQKARTALVDDCRVKIDKLRIQTEEELRQLDISHGQRMEQLERTITALKGLRGA